MPIIADDLWYFAYGSNLWIDQKERRTSRVRQGEDAPRIAYLGEYRFAFNKRGKNGQVFANIIPQPGGEVVGVAYRCNRATIEEMDAWEPGYEPQMVRVTCVGGEQVEALTYVAAPSHLTAEGRPTPEYLERIVTGARQHGLPKRYIAEIERLAGLHGSSGEAAG